MIYEIHFINLCLERYSLFRILLGFSFLRAAIQFNKNLSNLGYAIYLQTFHGMLSLQYQHFQSFNPRNRAPFMLLYQTINIFELRITFNVKHCQMNNGPKAWVVLTQILMKFHLQKLDQASTSKFSTNWKIIRCVKASDWLTGIPLDQWFIFAMASQPFRLNWNIKI